MKKVKRFKVGQLVAIVFTAHVLLSCEAHHNTHVLGRIEETQLTNESAYSSEDESLESDTIEISAFYKITDVPRGHFNVDSELMESECGDENYWKVVKLGKDAVPFLINKIESTTVTSVKHPCSDIALTEGVLAFILLEELLNIPYFSVFDMQYDSYEIDCRFPSGLLADVKQRPEFFHTKLTMWYSSEKEKYQRVKLENEDKTKCHEEFGVTHILRYK